jgi:elongation factor Ts
MEIGMDKIRDLRERTGVSVMQCQKALSEAGGDLEKAEELLRKNSASSVKSKADRTLGAGCVASYIHDGVVGAMVLLSSETDFVAKNPEFAALAREVAMHVSAMAPETVEELLAQPFIKDTGKSIQDLLSEATQKFGERIELSSFKRLSAR